MRMKLEAEIAGRHVFVIEPKGRAACPAVYLHAGSEEEAEAIWRLTGGAYVLVCIMGVDWNRDMSPWPAPRAFASGEDFAGGADRYLSELAERIVPEAERSLACKPSMRGIAGYSLSELFALYALYKSDLFTVAGSMSGSLWFDGWMDFMRGKPLKTACPRVYLSLGDRESKTKNARLATVESCTRQAAEILRERDADVFLEMNPGNHFVDVAERSAKGIRWMVS